MTSSSKESGTVRVAGIGAGASRCAAGVAALAGGSETGDITASSGEAAAAGEAAADGGGCEGADAATLSAGSGGAAYAGVTDGGADGLGPQAPG